MVTIEANALRTARDSLQALQQPLSFGQNPPNHQKQCLIFLLTTHFVPGKPCTTQSQGHSSIRKSNFQTFAVLTTTVSLCLKPVIGMLFIVSR